MQLTMRPYVTAGVALMGASVIAVAPVVPSQPLHAPTLPQVHMPAVQLTALDNPLEVFAPIVTAVQQLLGDTANVAATSINPLLRQVVMNQLYTLQQAQQLIGNVAGGLGTIGAALPGTLQAVGAQLATGNVNGAIDAFQSGIILGAAAHHRHFAADSEHHAAAACRRIGVGSGTGHHRWVLGRLRGGVDDRDRLQ